MIDFAEPALGVNDLRGGSSLRKPLDFFPVIRHNDAVIKSESWRTMDKKTELLRSLKFLLFSVSAGIIEIVAFALLNETLGWPYWPCYLIALVLSVLWNFTLNRRYTFRSANNAPVAMAKVFLFYLIFTPASTLFGNWLAEGLGWNKYLVTGINQRVERMGRSIIMRISGAEKIFPGDVISGYQYYVTAKEGVSFETLKAQVEAYAKTKGITVHNDDMLASMDSTIASVVAALKAICVVIAVLTIIIVIFVESLVIRAKIAREWRGLGISKALGQTSGGLITQIMLSNIPAILTGAILGGLLSPLVGGNMIKAAFSLFAVKKVDFHIPAQYVLLTIAGIVIVAAFTSATAGLKVRKLKPVTMITEE